MDFAVRDQAMWCRHFSYASDYPHEVDLVTAKQMIHDTVERPDLTHSEKAAVLGGNAKRFFRV